MKEKYYNDPYLVNFESTIVEITSKGLILEDTIFYPEGGGQDGDIGQINSVNVIDTKKEDGKIVHIVDDPSLFSIGQKVSLSLDWNNRYRLMKEHTAQHLISGIMFTDFSLSTIAIHLGLEFITIETTASEISDSTLLEVEDRVNEEIRKDKIVIIDEVSHEDAEKRGLRREIKVEGDVRIVSIENVDQIACGGLHVKSLKELEEVTYISQEKIRGHIRTTWKISSASIKERRDNKDIISSLSHVLSSKKEDLVTSVNSLVSTNNDLKKEVERLNKEIASLKLDSYLKEGISVFISDIPLNFYNDALKLLPVEENIIILSENNGNVTWLIHSSNTFFNDLKTQLLDFKLLGGGKEPIFQGKIANGDIDSFYKAIQNII